VYRREVRTVRIASILAVALAVQGCTFTHRCPVPDPVVEAAPPERIPLTIAVRSLPAAVPPELARQRDPYHVWIVDASPPTQVLFDRLAASMFARVVPEPSAADADAVIEVRLDRLAFDLDTFGPYDAAVGYHVSLRARDGWEIAAFDASGAARRPLEAGLTTHCAGIGKATAAAMQDAGAAFVGWFARDPGVAAWFAGRGDAVPQLTVRPPSSYAPPREVAAAASAPPPAPIGAAKAMAPRTFQLRFALGVFLPDDTRGRLEGGEKGVAMTVLGAEYRIRSVLALALELGGLSRSYSGRTLPPAGPFARQDGISLDSRTLGFGLRTVLPGGPFEPWIQATAHVIRTELCGEYVVFGLGGCGSTSTDWGTGIDIAGGVNVFPGRRWFLGFEARRLLAHATLAPIGGASIGGVGISAVIGLALP
jgi:hypothetical protein